MLSHHFVRILIFPDPEKHRLSETVIPCPLREFYLADHHRFDPVAPPDFSGGKSLVPPIAASRRKVIKRTFFNPDFAKLRIESAQKFVAKASSDSASKFELLAFIKTHQQSAKILTRSLRFGVPPDDKFLLLMELNLNPRSRTATFTDQYWYKGDGDDAGEGDGDDAGEGDGDNAGEGDGDDAGEGDGDDAGEGDGASTLIFPIGANSTPFTSM